MNEKKRARLEKQGWKVGSVKEFLALSPKEVALVEARLALGRRAPARPSKHR
jgi:hypothetical protein